jgi:HD-GYP domain-containing protein (c-di-GMP phosphodiesterase class II)
MAVFLQPAHGWRYEPDQVVSPVTRRLLAWMKWVRLDAASDIEEVGRDIAAGLAALTEASAVVVLARQWPAEKLSPLAGVRAVPIEATNSGMPASTAFDMWTFDADAQTPFVAQPLLSVLPAEPFWPAEAPAHLQIFAGEIIDYVAALHPLREGVPAEPVATPTGPILESENVAADITPPPNDMAEVMAGPVSENSDVATHSTSGQPLLVPLRGLQQSGAAPIAGLALVWLYSEDGLVSSLLQAPLEVAALQAGGWLSGALRTERLGRSYRELAEVCANAIDGRDAKRMGHSGAVAYYCGLIARSLGLSETDIERIEFAGLLHDIGKVAVPDAILQKNAPLTLDELETVRSSTITGADWISGVEGLEQVSAIVRSQAERWDGSGFPDGLQGTDIPQGARILAVALRFSAMTKPRADRAAMSVVTGAFEVLANEAGRSLDPEVVRAFLASMGRSMEHTVP